MRLTSQIMLAAALTLLELHAMSQSKQLFLPSDPRIEYGGRWEMSDSSHYRYSWPGVYVCARFTGRSIGVRLTDATNYYNVEIDGAFHGVFHPAGRAEADYILAEGLSDTVHSLRLSRRNITFDEIYSFAGFILDSARTLLPPTALQQRKIEFIGDSFTAGESNETLAQSLDWEARYPVTNIDKGFAPVIARHFNAQYVTTCRSGSGIVCDWQGNVNESIPIRFDRVFMDSETPKWDFSRWIPDVAVVSLGLNDISGLRGANGNVSKENTERFVSEYHKFLSTIRLVYPRVKIVIVSPFPEWIRTQERLIVDEERRLGRNDIFYATYDEVPGGYVGNGHPTVATHRVMAEQIIKAMESFNLFDSSR
ncbi:MAG TPA: hypothetical protein VK470_10285 [Bacteroidota bacterium]|nr:hypothetical protein [Bacteroidota bacterium]